MTQIQTCRIRFATHPEYIHHFYDAIKKLLDIHPMNKKTKHQFIIGLGEATENAIVHGNKYDPDKLIKINYTLDKEKIACTLTDQGPGFDHQKQLARPLSEYNLQNLIRKGVRGRVSGMGLSLIRKCMDEISFNETGNRITLVKYLKT